jgi:hypothetical protein
MFSIISYKKYRKEQGKRSILAEIQLNNIFIHEKLIALFHKALLHPNRLNSRIIDCCNSLFERYDLFFRVGFKSQKEKQDKMPEQL